MRSVVSEKPEKSKSVTCNDDSSQKSSTRNFGLKGPIQLYPAGQLDNGIKTVEICKRALRSKFKNFEDHVTNVSADIHYLNSNIVFRDVIRQKEITELEKAAEKSQKEYETMVQRWETSKCSRNCEQLIRIYNENKMNCTNTLVEKDELIAKYRKDLKIRKSQFEASYIQKEKDIPLLQKRLKEFVSNVRNAGNQELIAVRDTLQEFHTAEYNFKEKSIDIQKKVEEVGEKYITLSHTKTEFEKKQLSQKIKFPDQLQFYRKQLSEELKKLKLILWNTEENLADNVSKIKFGKSLLSLQMKEMKIIRSETLRSRVRYFDYQLKLKNHLKQLIAESVKQVNELENERKQHEHLIHRKTRAELHHKTNINRYDQVFKNKLRQTKETCCHLLEIENLIFEHILQEKFQPPDISFLNGTVEPISRLRPQTNTVPEEKKRKAFVQSLIVGADFLIPTELSTKSEKETISITKPMDVKGLLQFVYNVIGFLVVVNKTTTNDVIGITPNTFQFMKENNFLAAVGIETVDHLKSFISIVLNRGKMSKNGRELLLSSKEVFPAFKEWKTHQCQWETALERKNYSKSQDLIHTSFDRDIWHKCFQAYSSEKITLWDSVFDLLYKHLRSLTFRSKVAKEVEVARRMRRELERMISHNLAGGGKGTAQSSSQRLESVTTTNSHNRAVLPKEEADAFQHIKEHLRAYKMNVMTR